MKEDRNNYYSGLYWSGMPDFNVSNAELRKEFKSILKFWLDKGVSGFRFDAAMHLYNSAKFENPDSNSLEKTVSFWQEMCSFVKSEKPDAMMVGEVWDSNGIRSEYIKAIGSVFHFDMGTKIISIIQNKKSGTNSLASSLISNYEELQKKREEIAMIFQHFNLLMQKNVLENVCFPLYIQKMRKKEARAKVI